MTLEHDRGDAIFFNYQIKFDDGRRKRFEVRLDKDTLDLLAEPRSDCPDWTRLGFHQCPNCALDPSLHPHCPVAANLVDLIEFFQDSRSYDECEVWIETRHRNYVKRAPLQSAASSLMGIYMVVSGCPILNKMRPMVETHLPFAAWDETCYRIISMYLTAQFFLHQRGEKPDWELNRLVEFFHDVYQVNSAFAKRLDAIKVKDGDANLNAISILNASVSITEMTIEAKDLAHWENLFLKHWESE